MKTNLQCAKHNIYIRKTGHVTGLNRRSLLVGPNGPRGARDGPNKQNAGP